MKAGARPAIIRLPLVRSHFASECLAVRVFLGGGWQGHHRPFALASMRFSSIIEPFKPAQMLLGQKDVTGYEPFEFTYMLTWEQLEQHAADERLIKWMSGLKQIPDSGRALYLVPEVHAAISQKPWPASDGERPQHTRERRQAMRQVLERFIKGHAMLVNRELKDLGSASALAHMRGYWEFRSMGRMEETRMFGFFPFAGAFVATAFCGRGAFLTQGDWDARRIECGNIWNGLFPEENWLADPWPVTMKEEMNVYLDRAEA